MKFLKYILVFLLIALLAGCDFLDYNEEDFISEKEEVLGDFSRVKSLLTAQYRVLPNGFNEIGGAMRSSASDDAVEANPVSTIHDFYNGSWSPIRAMDNRYSELYSSIRDANFFIANVDTTIVEEYKYNNNYDVMRDQIQYFRPESRFLRAYFYFELLRRYGGGIPLLTNTISDADSANAVSPASTEEIIDFIVQETDDIIDRLPADYENVLGKETGRATKGVAMALKARTLLYAASPLFNESNEISKWEEAAEASFAIINSGLYSLENSYSDVVNKFPSDELILGRRMNPNNSFEQANYPVGFAGAQPGTAPSQNLVDTYEMQNGQDIEDPGSGYDINNPYKNRDPRLTKTVIVNNATWNDRPVEIWDGGVDGPPQEYATPTGYYLKKYVIENLNIVPPNTTTQEHMWVYFRYAEVLLNFAEAMNEAYGPQSDPNGYGMTAYDAVNMVKNRAGMPNFTAGMTQAKFREELREERRVELAFENHRFWDIRRWQIGEVTEEIWGMKIMKSDPEIINYQKEVVQNRNWDQEMYFYPIPQNELFVNDNLSQNLGW